MFADVRNLAMAHLEGRWGSKMRTYTGPSLLVIDELGYLPLDQESAHWFFEVVSRLNLYGCAYRCASYRGPRLKR